MKKVYIASPYTIGNKNDNVNVQIDMSNKLLDLGFAPYAPLFSHFLNLKKERTWEFWMNLCKLWVLQCDCVLRLSGDSTGADIEEKWAKEHEIPVFYTVESLYEYYQKERE